MKKMLYGKWQRIFAGILFLICCMVAGCSNKHEGSGQTNVSPTSGNPTLEVHFIDVGQGDCTLIRCGDHAMLIDAGENGCGTSIQNYLQKLGIKKLDYVIGTHPDADHIGGLDVILTKFDCEVILFPDAQSDTVAYERVVEAIEYRNYQVTNPELFTEYSLGEAAFTIIGPAGIYEEESNNNSIALKMNFGENSFLFLGDSEKEALTDMLKKGADINCDVMKAGHHGSSDSADREFLEAAGPKYAVISCGMGNDYGHPHRKTLYLLQELGISVFRTDEQGTVKAVSDGREITWSHMPSQTWQAGVYQADQRLEDNKETGKGEDQEETPADYKYILNTGSFKFHKPECESVSDMSKRNKKGSNLTREEIMELGYVPCNNCKP